MGKSKNNIWKNVLFASVFVFATLLIACLRAGVLWFKLNRSIKFYLLTNKNFTNIFKALFVWQVKREWQAGVIDQNFYSKCTWKPCQYLTQSPNQPYYPCLLPHFLLLLLLDATTHSEIICLTRTCDEKLFYLLFQRKTFPSNCFSMWA